MKYMDKAAFKKDNYFGTGIYNFFMRKYMTGKSYMKPISMAGGAMMFCNVTFEPGARCFWHIHRAATGGGQILICTAGEGWYQEEGKEPVSLRPGMVVSIDKDVLHWHGAKKDSWFSHIAVEIGGEGVKNEFVRPVSEEEYKALPEVEEVRIEGDFAFEKENVFGKGVPNDQFAQYFIGNSYLNFLTIPQKGKPFVANVTFEPGCRNNWHIHKSDKGGGQALVCTAGEGWYVRDGVKPRSLKKGDFVFIPSNVKHWHGAKKDSWFSHLSVEIPGENCSNEWLEPVDDIQYAVNDKNHGGLMKF